MATAKTAKPETPKAEATVVELPKIEVPEAVRAVAEKSVTQAKAFYDNVKSTSEEATDLIEESYANTTKGLNKFGLKVIETARDNANAAFDFATALFNAKSVSEAIEIQTSHARKQIEAATAQSKELSQLATQVLGETAKPYQALTSKAFTFGR